MTAVLVTGSSGFLGYAVASALTQRGVTTIGLDPAPIDSPKFKTITDDLSQPARIADHLHRYGISHVVHCGGISAPHLAKTTDMLAINAGGSLNLFLACITAKITRLVYASSTAVLGLLPDQIVRAETPIRPRNSYAFSKAAVEQMIGCLKNHEPTQFCILRYGGIYGPGRRAPILPHRLIEAAIAGEHVCLPSNDTASYIFIDDAANASISACFCENISDHPYHIVHPERVTPFQIAKAVQSIIPAFTFENTNEPRCPPPAIFDISPAQRDFGFDPQIGHLTGIDRVYRAMIKNISKQDRS